MTVWVVWWMRLVVRKHFECLTRKLSLTTGPNKWQRTCLFEERLIDWYLNSAFYSISNRCTSEFSILPDLLQHADYRNCVWNGQPSRLAVSPLYLVTHNHYHNNNSSRKNGLCLVKSCESSSNRRLRTILSSLSCSWNCCRKDRL